MPYRVPKGFSLDWYGREVEKRVAATVARRMERVMLYLEGVAKKKVSIRNSPRKRVGRSGMRGLNPSQEGEPPKLVEGTLRANITHVVVSTEDAIIGVLGVAKGPADDYGRRLELGFKGVDAAGRTVDQGPRPYLRPTITEERDKIVKGLSGD